MHIEGKLRPRTIVRIDGRRVKPNRSQRVWNHSPDGFSWGYAGSGPAQLALAILLHAKVPAKRAVRLHQELKADLVQHLPQGDFVTDFDLEGWLHARADA